MEDRTWTGTLTLVRTVGFSQRAGRGRHGFTGTAEVYAFAPDDPKCKVAYTATVRGVPHEVMCSSSGDVGTAILRSAGLAHAAKGSGVRGDYDTFPSPIGRVADRLQAREETQALTFYRKR